MANIDTENATYYNAYRPFTSASVNQYYRPFSRQRTSYSSMNQWRDKEGTTVPQTLNGKRVPVRMAEGAWKKTKPKTEDVGWPIAGDTLNAARQPNTEEFNKSYVELMNRVAYRYPNPGAPRIRQGRVGGTWRHIKEVQSNNTDRVVYVDGLVRVYDTQKFNSHLLHSGIAPTAKSATPIYVSRSDQGYQTQLQGHIDNRHYKPWYTEKVERVQDTGLSNLGRMDPSIKYKGFYKLNPHPTNIRAKLEVPGF